MPLILGVERISSAAWALLIGCHYRPDDTTVWVDEAPPQRPQAITSYAPGYWRAQFSHPLPSAALVYACGQSATLVVATPEQPTWLIGILGLGLIGTGLLGIKLIRQPTRRVNVSTTSPTTIGWRAVIYDEQGERTISLPDGILTIGSDPACHLIVLAPDIALRHAQLILNKETAQIVDLASPSGVFNGPVRRRLRPHLPFLIDTDQDLWLGATVRMRLMKN